MASYDRNVEARSLGFRNYYEVRIRGGMAAARRGEIVPDTPRPTGQELRQARGHASVRDLFREIQPDSSIRLATNIRNIETNDAGDFVSIPVTVASPDGEERDYWLNDISWDELERILDELDEIDVDYDSESSSTNLAALVHR